MNFVTLDDYGSCYNPDNNTLTVNHDWGLLSNASVTMNALLAFHRTQRERFVDVRWEKQLMWNKSDGESRNIFNLYFKPVENTQCDFVTPQNIFLDLFIGDTRRFDFSLFSQFRDMYFRFSDEVCQMEKLLVEKYQIDFEKTFAVLYRGTDKVLDTPRIHPYHYLQALFSNAPITSDSRVLIQTDQAQALDYIRGVLGVRNVGCFNIEEMPVTRGDNVMHRVVQDRYNLGVNYLAVVSIISKLKYVVMDTNNATIWVGILRGNLHNTCQMFAEVKSICQ